MLNSNFPQCLRYICCVSILLKFFDRLVTKKESLTFHTLIPAISQSIFVFHLAFQVNNNKVLLNSLNGFIAGGNLKFENSEVQHERGKAVIHHGKATHTTTPLKRGERINIVMWCKCPPKFEYWSQLPFDVQKYIIKQLNSRSDLLAITSCNKKLHSLQQTDDFWKDMYFKTFSSIKPEIHSATVVTIHSFMNVTDTNEQQGENRGWKQKVEEGLKWVRIQDAQLELQSFIPVKAMMTKVILSIVCLCSSHCFK
jgi:hypothetical protein